MTDQRFGLCAFYYVPVTSKLTYPVVKQGLVSFFHRIVFINSMKDLREYQVVCASGRGHMLLHVV